MEDIEVSNKHIKLRVIVFIIALLVGIAAFAFAFYKLTNKETGYYEVKATPDESAPLYDSGYVFYCFIDGKSNEIKSNLNKLGTLYSETLGRISRLLDPKETYEGYVNLATLNQHPGEEVRLPAELYDILIDALERSEANGFTIYDGAVKAFWQELLYLDEPQSFDPLHDADQNERMQAAAEAIRSSCCPKLTVTDASSHTVKLEVPAEYLALTERYEIDAPILDLGVMREAYTLQYVYQKLIENGITQGYLRTQSGMNLMLPQTDTGILPLYGYLDATAVTAAEITLGKGAACCALRSFSLGEAGYYSVDGVLRHPYPGPDGAPNSRLLTAWVASGKGDLVDVAAKAVSLYAASPEDAKQKLIEFGADRLSAAIITVDDPGVIVSDPQHAENVHPIEKYGYTVSVP